MIRERLERIKERAYALWERAGRSHGQHEAHWHQASSEIDAEEAVVPKAKTKAKTTGVIGNSAARLPVKPQPAASDKAAAATSAKTARAPAGKKTSATARVAAPKNDVPRQKVARRTSAKG